MSPRPIRQCAGPGWAAFARDRRGGSAVIFSLSLMVLALLVCGGIEMADLMSERTKLRNVADATALWGATGLALTGEDGLEERAKAWAEGQLAHTKLRSTTTVETRIVELGGEDDDEPPGLKVTIRGQRDSFFGNLFPPGGFKIGVSSTAQSVAKVPLCILAHGSSQAVRVKDTSNVAAPGCLVHSNEDIRVDGGAKIEAGLAQAVNSVSGPIDPDGNGGAKSIDDPFKDLPITAKGGCGLTLPPLLQEVGILYLQPGTHCQDLEVFKHATLRLAPGEHHFVDADIVLREDAELWGEDVVLVFDKKSKIDFKERSKVNLKGRRSGTFAGFLLVATRDNAQNFTISSDNVEELLGTIYVPAGRLVVDGKEEVARQSAWTVIVAKQVELKGDPTLVMNTDYNIGGVPVPAGVGAKSMDSRLVK